MTTVPRPNPDGEPPMIAPMIRQGVTLRKRVSEIIAGDPLPAWRDAMRHPADRTDPEGGPGAPDERDGR